MKKSTKAVLLSALIYPGAGHLFLKKHIVASIFISISTICLYVLISTAIDRALAIAEPILKGEIPLDTGTIINVLAEHSFIGETQLIERATLVLAIVWCIGVVDSYRVSRIKKGAVDAPPAQQ